MYIIIYLFIFLLDDVTRHSSPVKALVSMNILTAETQAESDMTSECSDDVSEFSDETVSVIDVPLHEQTDLRRDRALLSFDDLPSALSLTGQYLITWRYLP